MASKQATTGHPTRCLNAPTRCPNVPIRSLVFLQDPDGSIRSDLEGGIGPREGE